MVETWWLIRRRVVSIIIITTYTANSVIIVSVCQVNTVIVTTLNHAHYRRQHVVVIITHRSSRTFCLRWRRQHGTYHLRSPTHRHFNTHRHYRRGNHHHHAESDLHPYMLAVLSSLTIAFILLTDVFVSTFDYFSFFTSCITLRCMHGYTPLLNACQMSSGILSYRRSGIR